MRLLHRAELRGPEAFEEQKKLSFRDWCSKVDRESVTKRDSMTTLVRAFVKVPSNIQYKIQEI